MSLMEFQIPLAHRLRPQSLNEIIGQEHITGSGKILHRFLEEKRLFSMIFFGPPGSGKTSVAEICAKSLNLEFILFNAVTGNKKDLDEIFAQARIARQIVLIVDEVHRLNKDKQDLLLPYVENGQIILIGMTTSNPYFSINPAIRSRVILVEFKALSKAAMLMTLENALVDKRANINLNLSLETKNALIEIANGDVRSLLNTLDVLNISYPNQEITIDLIHQLFMSSNQSFHKDDDGYYDALSALQKSIRGSQVDAALYYLAKLLVAQDIESIERRVLVTAYEDIGLANPALVARTLTAFEVARRVGFPEALYPLATTIIDLALSPKSKSAALALGKAIKENEDHPLQVPNYLRLTPVNLSKENQYDYGRADLWHQIEYLPEDVKELPFYTPNSSSPYENTLANNLNSLNQIKRSRDLKSLKYK